MRCYLGFFALSTAIASGQSLPDNVVPSIDSPVASALPSVPGGLSTVLGGAIQNVDLVRDRFALKVPGANRVQILFDERTQVYRDGKRISVLDMHDEDHASVETTLDGTAIFALRIHMLSAPLEGRLRGQVVSYNAATGELKLHVAGAKDAVALLVAQETPIGRVGQAEFTGQQGGFGDLVRGTLVNVTFKARDNSPGVATAVHVLAVPGAESVFRGNLASLDLRAGHMSIANASEDSPTDIDFKPSHFAASRNLRQGSSVTVTALFDGTRYVASNIAIE